MYTYNYMLNFTIVFSYTVCVIKNVLMIIKTLQPMYVYRKLWRVRLPVFTI